MKKADVENLIKVWKVLDLLTVSLDRMGHYELKEGKTAAAAVLREFMGPPVFKQIARARTLVDSVLVEYDPKIGDRLEQIGESEQPYWNGPKRGRIDRGEE